MYKAKDGFAPLLRHGRSFESAGRGGSRMKGRTAQTRSAMLVTVCALLGLVWSLVALSVLGAVDREQDTAPAGFATELRTGRVPSRFTAWVQRAGRLCKEVSAPLVAAQIEAESGWNPAAV